MKKLYTFIIQIANTILNQCISPCLYKIGHTTKACIMHNREITHIVKTDSLSKTQLVVRNKCSFCCHLRETYVKTKKTQSFYETTMQKLDLRL